MKLSEVYKYGLLNLFKIMVLILLEIILIIMFVITMPLWWSEHIKILLSSFGKLIEDVMTW